MQTWVIGNWKQNPATKREVEALLEDIVATIDSGLLDSDHKSRCQ